ncbi:hypothetical protein E4U17_000725 [Claviceps sp. LM77 group G4]|nr:hypothetical protein E4U17_000725 [Claviceps sp. LM77 group G4]KAG6085305.1 hypothetical protein E4U33_002096 [Claviceps sp. LM78 group G4]
MNNPIGWLRTDQITTGTAYGGIMTTDPHRMMPAYNSQTTQNHIDPRYLYCGEPVRPAIINIAWDPYRTPASNDPAVTLLHNQPPFYYGTPPAHTSDLQPTGLSAPGTHMPIVASTSHHGRGHAAKESSSVVVTSIQYKAWPSEVSDWIRYQIGEHSLAITNMNIPLEESKDRIRGHAYVTLANSTAAKAVVRILNQKLFQGRVIGAKLLTARSKDVGVGGHDPAIKDTEPGRSDEAGV